MSLMVVLRLKSEALIERLYHLSRDIMSHDFLTTPLDNVSRLKDMLSMMIDEIEDGILFLSNAGRPIFENNAFHSMLNLDPGLRQSPDLLNYLPEELTRQMAGRRHLTTKSSTSRPPDRLSPCPSAASITITTTADF